MNQMQPHICLDSSNGAHCALLPGDPKRLDRIAAYLTDVCELAYNREFRSLSGTYKGMKVLAVSTGIGGASCAIAVEELSRLGIDTMVRIGSCGALQKGIGLGDLILVCGAVRDDGTSRTYAEDIYPAVPDHVLLRNCIEAADGLGLKAHVGLARSHDSFYSDGQEKIQEHWAKLGVLGCDMETAALFVAGRLRGVRTASILNNVVLADGDTAEGIGSYVGGEDLTSRGESGEILTALEALLKAENK